MDSSQMGFPNGLIDHVIKIGLTLTALGKNWMMILNIIGGVFGDF